MLRKVNLLYNLQFFTNAQVTLEVAVVVEKPKTVN